MESFRKFIGNFSPLCNPSDDSICISWCHGSGLNKLAKLSSQGSYHRGFGLCLWLFPPSKYCIFLKLGFIRKKCSCRQLLWQTFIRFNLILLVFLVFIINTFSFTSPWLNQPGFKFLITQQISLMCKVDKHASMYSSNVKKLRKVTIQKAHFFAAQISGNSFKVQGYSNFS